MSVLATVVEHHRTVKIKLPFLNYCDHQLLCVCIFKNLVR